MGLCLRVLLPCFLLSWIHLQQDDAAEHHAHALRHLRRGCRRLDFCCVVLHLLIQRNDAAEHDVHTHEHLRRGVCNVKASAGCQGFAVLSRGPTASKMMRQCMIRTLFSACGGFGMTGLCCTRRRLLLILESCAWCARPSAPAARGTAAPSRGRPHSLQCLRLPAPSTHALLNTLPPSPSESF